MVKDGKVEEKINAVELDISSIAKGIYMISIQQNDTKTQQRLMVE